jgi:hypothetical protein
MGKPIEHGRPCLIAQDTGSFDGSFSQFFHAYLIRLTTTDFSSIIFISLYTATMLITSAVALTPVINLQTKYPSRQSK